jgi:hypothetical protein
VNYPSTTANREWIHTYGTMVEISIEQLGGSCVVGSGPSSSPSSEAILGKTLPVRDFRKRSSRVRMLSTQPQSDVPIPDP